MPGYLRKLAKFGQQIILIDAFAGPGNFDDKQRGSPLIICQAAEQHAQDRYKAIFVNSNRKYHEQLSDNLNAAGWGASTLAIHGDGQQLIKQVYPILSTSSVFLYIDPFGLDCEFATIEPFLKRDVGVSTEILINMNTAGFHRLAARNAIAEGKFDEVQIAKSHDKLTRTLGGDYWKEALLSDDPKWGTKSREQFIIDGYRKKLQESGYLKYTGACPVMNRRDSVTKYHMIFASRHPDAIVLMNDAMCTAFNEYIHETETKDTFFADQHWTQWHDTSELKKAVINMVSRTPSVTRKELWTSIVLDHFMQFTESEYKRIVAELIETDDIRSTTVVGSPLRKTKRLNDDCVLVPT